MKPGDVTRAPRVAITRPVDGAVELAHLLHAAGADPVIVPLTRIAPPEDALPLTRALERVGLYDWLVFTSVNAVTAVAAQLEGEEPGPTVRIAAVGSATGQAVRSRLRREADVIPDTFTGTAIVPAMRAAAELKGARVLWPRAEGARPELAAELRAAGAHVEDPVAYRTLPDHGGAERLSHLIRERAVDVVTFTAPSAVRSAAAVHATPLDVVVAVIGSTTAAAAAALGMRVDVHPSEHTMQALTDAVMEHWRARDAAE